MSTRPMAAVAALLMLRVASSSLACERPPANRTFLFYNRVPKAGSESVIQEMRARMDGGGSRRDGKRGACGRVCDIPNTRVRVRSEAFMVEREAACRRAIRPEACPRLAERRESPIAVEGHVFYFEWPARLAEERPLWLNVLRDPIARCQSRYDYDKAIADAGAAANRRGGGRAAHSARGAWPPTLDACIASGACAFGATRRPRRLGAASDKGVNGSRWAQMIEECGSNYQTRWMCGMSPECLALRFDDPRLLTIAKAHVDAHVAVGLVEQLDASLRLFHALLPAWFGPSASFCGKCAPSGGARRRRRPAHAELSRASLDELRRHNELDLELVAYARARLERQLVACGVDAAEGARAHAHIPRSRTAAAAASAICALAVAGLALRAAAQRRPRPG